MSSVGQNFLWAIPICRNLSYITTTLLPRSNSLQPSVYVSWNSRLRFRSEKTLFSGRGILEKQQTADSGDIYFTEINGTFKERCIVIECLMRPFSKGWFICSKIWHTVAPWKRSHWGNSPWADVTYGNLCAWGKWDMDDHIPKNCH